MIGAFFSSANNNSDSLKKQSEDALSVFRSTMMKLQSINTKATEQQVDRLREIAEAQEEVARLEILCEDNTKIIKKNDSIIN